MSKATIAKITGETVKHEAEELFSEHRELLHRTAYRVTGSPEDADDVVQVVFVRLLRHKMPLPSTTDPVLICVELRSTNR